MKKISQSTRLFKKKTQLISVVFLGLAFLGLTGQATFALELEPYPLYDFSHDPFSISFFREERPSFYWVNSGVPDAFFRGVEQLVFGPIPPNPVVFSVRSIEYGFQTSLWITHELQLRVTIPFEANALEDANLDPLTNTYDTHNLAKFGDMELAGTYLLAGKRESGNFAGLDGWYRFPTGTNPFNVTYPLLSTGKGAPVESIGAVAGQELGGFSFFQSIHYEKTEPITVDAANALFGPGVFQWPENWHAAAQIEYTVFHRAQRFVSLFYEFRARLSGQMLFNQQVLTYGDGLTRDQLFFSTTGFRVRVDKEFSAQGTLTFLPFELPNTRPDVGWLFSLVLVFRPI